MAPAFAKVYRALPLALCLAATGCAQLFGGGQRQPKDGTNVVYQRPPEPAPALFIPGPSVAAKTVSSPQESGATILPPITPAIAKGKAVDDEPAKEVISPLRQLYDQAAQRYEKMPCHSLRMRRREVVGNQQKPEEIIACKFRQDPYSLHFKWLGPEGKNREIVYVKGSKDNLIHTLTAAGDGFFLPAGKHLPIPADSPLVRSRSRYAITEAAVGAWIVKYGRLVQAIDKDAPQAGTAKVLGVLKRPEFEDQVVAVLHRMSPGWEPLLPRGGQRLWFFDPDHHLPVLIITHDETGREVEYYCLDQYRFTVPMTDDDFDPVKLWKK